MARLYRAPRLPIAHLIDARDLNLKQLAADLACSTRTMERWVEEGIPLEEADQFACVVLNLHPCSVPGWAWASLNRYDDLAAAPEAVSLFEVL